MKFNTISSIKVYEVIGPTTNKYIFMIILTYILMHFNASLFHKIHNLQFKYCIIFIVIKSFNGTSESRCSSCHSCSVASTTWSAEMMLLMLHNRRRAQNHTEETI